MNPIVFSDNVRHNFDIHRIYKILSTDGIVIFKNQKLSAKDQEQILNRNFLLNPEYQTNLDNINDLFVTDSKLLLRVTKKLNENNVPGAFNNIEGLPWHSDNPTDCEDRLLTWLYGFENTVGSSTVYCNTDLAFNDLPISLKELAKSLVAHTTNRFIYNENRNYVIPLYNHCGLGNYCWTFPYTQIKHFEGYNVEQSKEIIETLKEYVLCDKYCYTHYWEDNDLIISNERLLIHKRPYYDKMDTRVLHKATMGFLTVE